MEVLIKNLRIPKDRQRIVQVALLPITDVRKVIEQSQPRHLNLHAGEVRAEAKRFASAGGLVTDCGLLYIETVGCYFISEPSTPRISLRPS